MVVQSRPQKFEPKYQVRIVVVVVVVVVGAGDFEFILADVAFTKQGSCTSSLDLPTICLSGVVKAYTSIVTRKVHVVMICRTGQYSQTDQAASDIHIIKSTECQRSKWRS